MRPRLSIAAAGNPCSLPLLHLPAALLWVILPGALRKSGCWRLWLPVSVLAFSTGGSPYLWSRGIRRLNAVAISHPHSDHIGGMRIVIANFRPRELWYGLDSPTPEFTELAATARAFGVSFKPRAAGDAFDFGGTQVRVLNPQPGTVATNRTQDDESMVLHIQYGGASALLVGDSHKRIEEIMESENPGANLLKISHHSSATSSSPDFLQAVSPQFAVVSAGYYNLFHHPRPDVMKRFADLQVRTYRTDLVGPVTFYLDGTTVSAQPALR